MKNTVTHDIDIDYPLQQFSLKMSRFFGLNLDFISSRFFRFYFLPIFTDIQTRLFYVILQIDSNYTFDSKLSHCSGYYQSFIPFTWLAIDLLSMGMR